MGTTANSNSQGEFKVEGLAPGKYAIFMLPQQESDVRADAVAFDVVDQDITELLIKSSPGISVAGTIVLENTDDKTVWTKLMQLSVQGFVRSETAAAAGNMAHQATINADGSFLMKGLEPGTAFLALAVKGGDRSLLKGFNIARIERDG